MLNSINGKFVTLGVTGSIASYKAVDLASKLTQKGAKVDVITVSYTHLTLPTNREV